MTLPSWRKSRGGSNDHGIKATRKSPELSLVDPGVFIRGMKVELTL